MAEFQYKTLLHCKDIYTEDGQAGVLYTLPCSGHSEFAFEKKFQNERGKHVKRLEASFRMWPVETSGYKTQRLKWGHRL